MKKKDSTIHDIDDYFDVIEKALIKAKTKEVKAEKQMIYSGIFVLALLFLGVMYIVFMLRSTGNSNSYLTLIISDNIILLWIAALFVTFFYFDSKTKNFEKAEKDYEELVEDIIDRSSDIWNTEELQRKKSVQFRKLKEKYDINLYHK